MINTTMLKTDIRIQYSKWKIEHAKTITAILHTAMTIIDPNEKEREVSVLLCDDKTIAAINHKWRQKNYPTNVLAFPQNDDMNVTNKPLCLGDIIIAFETTRDEALEKGMHVEEHMKLLTVHGFLHLFGYDHQNDKDAEIMEKLEQKILKKYEKHNL